MCHRYVRKYVLLILLAPDDFDDPEQLTLQFNSTNTTHHVSITVVDDAVLEDMKRFFVELASEQSAVVLQPQRVEVVIADNDGMSSFLLGIIHNYGISAGLHTQRIQLQVQLYWNASFLPLLNP